MVAFARTPGKLQISHARLHIFRGDAMEYTDVDAAVAGADAVLSALGHGRTTPAGMQTEAARNIVRAMENHGVRRLIDLTNSGVRRRGDRPPITDKVLVALLEKFGRKIIDDGRGHAREIQSSGLDWVIARATRLTKGKKAGRCRSDHVIRAGIPRRIPRADMAGFMLDQVTDDTYRGGMPYVGAR